MGIRNKSRLFCIKGKHRIGRRWRQVGKRPHGHIEFRTAELSGLVRATQRFSKDMQTVHGGANIDMFGFYELADDGTILYSRLRSDGKLSAPERQIVGKDFFRDIAQFENTDDLRRHFKRFIMGDQPANTFVFDCLYQTEVVRAKVFMTRAYEVDYDHAGGIVIMDIRQATQ